jgi:hypothetical protein
MRLRRGSSDLPGGGQSNEAAATGAGAGITRGFFIGADETSSGEYFPPVMENRKLTRGRPPHYPSAFDRRLVVALSSEGVAQSEISSVLGIDPKTLRLRYRHELDVGASKLEAALVLHLFRLAGGKGSVALRAIRFVLQCKFGWSPYAPPPRG